MQTICFLFVKRRWEEDKYLLKQTLDYLINVRCCNKLGIFPEGTDLHPKSRKQSDKYAEKHHLTKYKYVIHPKSSGFVHVVRLLQQNNHLDAIYDLTIGYPDFVAQVKLI